MTALSKLEILKKKRACIATSGASFCHSEGIEVISIVRKEEQVTMLNKLTLCLVLNSSSGSFLAELKQVIDQL